MKKLTFVLCAILSIYVILHTKKESIENKSLSIDSYQEKTKESDLFLWFNSHKNGDLLKSKSIMNPDTLIKNRSFVLFFYSPYDSKKPMDSIEYFIESKF